MSQTSVTEILINVTHQEVRIALLENNALLEVHIERNMHHSLLGNIYKGKVNRVARGIEAAFIDIGENRSAFLHLDDIQERDKRIFPGQYYLVQVYKEPIGSKGARLTTQITLASRYLVLTPGTNQVAISQKITDENERQRLLSIVVPKNNNGYILRTAAIGATQAEIEADMTYLEKVWQTILSRAKSSKSIELIYEEIPLIQRVLRDLAPQTVTRIQIDHLESMLMMRDFANRFDAHFHDRIELYTGTQPIFDFYGIELELQNALQRKVQLKSGGYLIFDQTEAMTTIDVNTGSNIGQATLEKTIFSTNLEAVTMIAKQIRLRNLGGIIIIDFIDMSDPQHKKHLLTLLEEALAKDTVKTEISELSSLGLVQMTRKRTRDSLEHILCIPCPVCQAKGSIKSPQTICYDIFRELNRLLCNSSFSHFLVVASKQIIDRLTYQEMAMIKKLQVQFNKVIELQVEVKYTEESYHILPLEKKVVTQRN